MRFVKPQDLTLRGSYDEIRKSNCDIKIIFVSGYAPDIIRQRGLVDDQVMIAFKPLSPRDLLKKVRSVLDGDKNSFSVSKSNMGT